MSNERDLLKQQREKWLSERALDHKMTAAGIDKNMISASSQQSLLTEITLKLSEKLQSELSQSKEKKLKKNDYQMEKTISKEIETNTCPICYDLMVPPKNSPILLFPCGHTFCKNCVMHNGTTKQISKCPCCRAVVKSSALNISLQNLICVFTNNKHLIDQNDSEEQKQDQKKGLGDESFKDNLKLCKIRCKILRDEMGEIIRKNQSLEENLVSQQGFLNKLYNEKKDVIEKIEKMNKELQLINNFIDENEANMSGLEKEVSENYSKLNLIQESLGPIEREREKYELLVRNSN